ncbi:hypothetical protein NORO109296_14490 [Nocardiopsis rhodophaea]
MTGVDDDAPGPAGLAWVPPAPHHRRPDYAQRAAAWVVELLPPALPTAVGGLYTHPLAAGRVAWVVARAMLDARRRDDTTTPLAMSAVVPAGLLNGLLPDDDIHLLRGLELPVDTKIPLQVLEERLRVLGEVGSHLPKHFVSG